MKTTPKMAFVKTALFSGLLMAVAGDRHGRSDRKEGDLALRDPLHFPAFAEP
jgi:hypothetical protein